MMLDTIPNHKLIRRHICMFEIAFIERGTNVLFIPLLDEVWLNQETDRMVRILSNKLRRVNMKAQWFKDTFIPVKANWEVLFLANPDTMIITKDK